MVSEQQGWGWPATNPPSCLWQSMYQSYGSPSQYGMAGSYGSATPQQPSGPQHQGTLNQVTPQPSSMSCSSWGCSFLSGLAMGTPVLFKLTTSPFFPSCQASPALRLGRAEVLKPGWV